MYLKWNYKAAKSLIPIIFLYLFIYVWWILWIENFCTITHKNIYADKILLHTTSYYTECKNTCVYRYRIDWILFTMRVTINKLDAYTYYNNNDTVCFIYNICIYNINMYVQYMSNVKYTYLHWVLSNIYTLIFCLIG